MVCIVGNGELVHDIEDGHFLLFFRWTVVVVLR